MDYKTLTIETKDHVCLLTLDRPPVNAVSMELRVEFESALNEIENNKDAWVLVITGSGDKAFSAGMDLKDIANIKKGPNGSDLWAEVDRFPRPVIAAINGFAFGGGCELAMACHFRFMTDSPAAKIGLTELNLGIIPGWGGTQRMTRLVGRSKAMDLIFFSRRLTAIEAKEIGLIDRVCKSSELMKEVMDFATELSKRPPIAVSCVLKSIAAGIDNGIDEGLKVEKEGSAIVAQSEDAKEGVTAFLQKRDPEFKGL